MSSGLRLGLMGLFVMITASAVDRLGADDVVAPAWGTGSESSVTVSAWAMQPLPVLSNGVATTAYDNFLGRYSADTEFFVGPLTLPSGALITAVEVQGCDSAPSFQIGATVFQIYVDGSSAALNFAVADAASGLPFSNGCGYFRTDSIPPFEVNNATDSYVVRAQASAKSSETTISAVRVFYRLRVSPAPADATFGDVPTTHPFFQFIEALGASGITAGCTVTDPPNFCPDAPLTRGQMAVFLSRALGLHWTP